MPVKYYCDKCGDEIQSNNCRENTLVIPLDNEKGKSYDDIEKIYTLGIRINLCGDKVDGGDTICEESEYVCVKCIYEYLHFYSKQPGNIINNQNNFDTPENKRAAYEDRFGDDEEMTWEKYDAKYFWCERCESYCEGQCICYAR